MNSPVPIGRKEICQNNSRPGLHRAQGNPNCGKTTLLNALTGLRDNPSIAIHRQ
ncbi:MAG: hypothetical protein EPO07_10080 [Verrucomicrobia bacterium]|nr:MAG: hypothetical protein EPO07_10080 [Verrucomicrobiota bacterium]